MYAWVEALLEDAARACAGSRPKASTARMMVERLRMPCDGISLQRGRAQVLGDRAVRYSLPGPVQLSPEHGFQPRGEDHIALDTATTGGHGGHRILHAGGYAHPIGEAEVEGDGGIQRRGL